MAKKSRSVTHKGRKPRLSPAQMVRPGMNEMAEPATPGASAESAGDASDLQQEYRYVLADLKRIGVIAVAMLAILIGLAVLLS